jgi:hypothetical protein
LLADKDTKVFEVGNSRYKIYFKSGAVFPKTFRVFDFFGAHIDFSVADPYQLHRMVIKAGRVETPYANPVYIDKIPKLCSRTQMKDGQLVYDAGHDILNRKPSIHLFDPDYQGSAEQKSILKIFDDKNILMITDVKINYDYEDNSILDYEGPHPITGKPHMVYEGQGGFYANFHYAVMPFRAPYLRLSRQEMLALVQGRLADIGRVDLMPAMRTHSFIPGPYASQDKVYELCEWGDTSFQAKQQQLRYQGLKIWDWDLIKEDKVIVVVWEGDEEAWMIEASLLDPFYMTDDIVGVFVVDRKKSKQPLILKNKSGNFTMTVLSKDAP